MYLILLFLVPFLPYLNPSSATTLGPYYLRESITILITIVIIISYLKRIKANAFILSLPQTITILFIIILLCQTSFLTSYISYSFEAISVISIGLVLSIILFNLPSEEKNKIISIISKTIIICCYIQVIICILQLNNISISFKTDFYSFDLTNSAIINFNLLSGSGQRIGGGLNQANNLADLLTWGLLANIVNWPISKNKLRLILAHGTMFILNIFISLTFSRIAILFAVFLICYGGMLYKKEKLHSRLLIAHGITLFLCLLIATKGFFNFAYTRYDAAGSNSQNNVRIEQSLNILSNLSTGKTPQLSASDSQRITLWERGWNEFIQHPIYGVGWNYYSKNLFDNDIKADTNPLPQMALPMNAHNIFIHMLATTGILGFLCIVGFFSTCLYQAWKQKPQQQVLIFGIISILLIHSQVEYPLFYTQFLYCLFILVGLCNDKGIFKFKNSKLFKLSCIFIAILTIWQVIVGINNFLILAQLKNPTNYMANNPLHNIIIKYKIAMNPFWSYYVDANFAEKLNFDKITPENNKLFDITYNATKNVEAFTPFPSYTIKLAYMELLKGNESQSKELIHKLINNYPDFTATIKAWTLEITKDNPNIQALMLKQIDNWHPTTNQASQ